jgi:hypothetical protein
VIPAALRRVSRLQARRPGPVGRAVGKGMHRWVMAWLRDRARKALIPRPEGERHLLFAVCDHYEPLHGRPPRDVALARVRAWRERYPRLASGFRDAEGRPPRHSFFFPGEEYDPAYVEPLAELVHAGLGEVEVHLHHDGDTRASLADKLRSTLRSLGDHGLVPARAGKPAWAFIHGNWALANGRPDGRWCGVDDELTLLHELGCYADFTFPSAPDPCQPVVVNRIYSPRDPAHRRAYDAAQAPAKRAGGASPTRPQECAPDRVLLVQGPLALARKEPHRGAGLRIESAALDAGDPPTPARLGTWLEQFVHVEGRPEWTFVKVHTHGAIEPNADVLLGAPMERLHRALAELAAPRPGDGGRPRWAVHYVTAREMYNVARAAMDGHGGSPAAYFDYDVPSPPRASR